MKHISLAYTFIGVFIGTFMTLVLIRRGVNKYKLINGKI